MTDTLFSSSEKRAMGTVLLTLVRPDTTDSLVIDSLPSRHKNHNSKVISGVHVHRGVLKVQYSKGNKETKYRQLTWTPALSVDACAEWSGRRGVGWRREGPLLMARASIHSVRDDLALQAAHKPETDNESCYCEEECCTVLQHFHECIISY